MASASSKSGPAASGGRSARPTVSGACFIPGSAMSTRRRCAPRRWRGSTAGWRRGRRSALQDEVEPAAQLLLEVAREGVFALPGELLELQAGAGPLEEVAEAARERHVAG